MELTTPLSTLSRVGATTARHLQRLGLRTAGDLLYYFPFRYEDYRRLVPIGSLVAGEAVTVRGRVEVIANRRTARFRKIITEAVVNDPTGSVRVVWFNQPFLIKNVHPGDDIFLSGAPKDDMLGIQFVSPAYEKAQATTAHTGRLVPIYPTTGGLTQKQLRSLASQVQPLAKTITDWLPNEVRTANGIISLPQALAGIHFPKDETELVASTNRLKFDELFLLQLQAERARRQRQQEQSPSLRFQEEAIKHFVSRLPFQLTKTQKIAAWEILQDIGKGVPMNRLLSGDVGSGKTVVAAMALYSATLNGYQGILMAPTEILAAQHFQSAKKLLADQGIMIALFTRTQREIIDGEKDNRPDEISKAEMVKRIAAGEVGIIIGTHALLSEDVSFKKLGLVIVDEQHRFGVEQRRIIKEKGKSAHFLSMTATPIPRSLALLLYGDLDLSVITELPPGRKKIITRLAEPSKRERAYQFIRDQVGLGRQVFVICPLIEMPEAGGQKSESGTRKSDVGDKNMDSQARASALSRSSILTAMEKKSVLSEYEKLSKKIFPDLRVGYLHGKMPAVEKEKTMQEFKGGKLDILVATSVVEVGVDVPNASVMMIEGADRFGLAQLHQFRGRVGRSVHQSYCLLFTDADSSRVTERLRYFETHHDGFSLAEKDLELRGPGEVYGTEQSGMQELRLATMRDHELIKKARETARAVADSLDRYPTIAARVSEWEQRVHLE